MDCNLRGIFRVLAKSGLSSIEPSTRQYIYIYTLPETNIFAPEMDGWNTFSFPFGAKGLFAGVNSLLVSGSVPSICARV